MFKVVGAHLVPEVLTDAVFEVYNHLGISRHWDILVEFGLSNDHWEGVTRFDPHTMQVIILINLINIRGLLHGITVIAHELRHAWQNLELLVVPEDTDPKEITWEEYYNHPYEVDAREYASKFTKLFCGKMKNKLTY